MKLFGDDFDVLAEKGRRDRSGAADDSRQRPTWPPSRSPASRCCRSRSIKSNWPATALPAKAVLDLVESIGSKPLGEVVEGQLRFPLVVRLPEEFRGGPQRIGVDADRHALGRAHSAVAAGDVEMVEGPSTITREWGQRRITRHRNVRGRDMGSFVAEARRKIAEQVALPPGRYRDRMGRPVREPASGPARD